MGTSHFLLFIITAVTCGFSALCYAEFGRVPVAGSAYTYSYVTLESLLPGNRLAPNMPSAMWW